MDLQTRPAYLSDPTRERLGNQVLNATTLEEIFEARSALRDWIKAYPEDTGMLDGGEQLAHMEEAAHFLAAEKARMTEAEWTAWTTRNALYHSASGPSSLAEVEEAEQGLHLWLCEHPDDEEMRGLSPTLALFREGYELVAKEDAAEAEAARRGSVVAELAAR